MKVEILYTEEFLESFVLAKEYIEEELLSPLAAQNFQDAIFDLIETTAFTPTIAIKRTSSNGVSCFVISHKNWNIYYTIENSTMKVLDLIHQSQNSSF